MKTHKTSCILMIFLSAMLLSACALAAQDIELPSVDGSPDIVALTLEISVGVAARCEVSYEGALVDVCHLSPGANAVTFQIGRCYADGPQPGSDLMLTAYGYDGGTVALTLNPNKAGDGPIQGIRGIALPEKTVDTGQQGIGAAAPEPRIVRPDLAVYPNPFNPSIKISFKGNVGEFALVRVFDLRGRLVNRLYSGPVRSRESELIWQGRDEQARTMASGVYFVHVYVEGRAEVKKVLLAK